MMEQHKTARWIAIVAVITLLAVFSWRLLAIALVAVACFAAFQSDGFRWFRPSTSRCLKCFMLGSFAGNGRGGLSACNQIYF